MKIADFAVRKMNSTEGREFIMEHHYSGTCHGGPMCWGLYDTSDDDRLVGVCAFATPIGENVRKYIWKSSVEDEMKNHTTELHRLVTLDECPHNTETWFISRALNGLKDYKSKYKAVISFADTTEGHDGIIYQASNALYYGMTDERTFYRDTEGNLKTPRSSGENITVSDADERGWTKEKRKAKHRYLFLLPDEYESKDDLKDLLAIDDQPYPNS